MNLAELSALAADALRVQTQRLLAFLPSLGGAIALLLIGWLLARAARAVVRRSAASLLNWISQRPIFQHSLTHGSLWTQVAAIAGACAFWIVQLLFMAAAVDQLGIPSLSYPISQLAFYAPRLLSALLVGVAGFVLGGIAKHWVTVTLAPLGVNQAQMLGHLAQFGTLAIGLIMAVDQAGIHSTILILALGIILTTTLGGIALAFAIGCGPIVGNMVASHYIGKRIAKGQIAQIGEHTGAVSSITNTFVVLQTERSEILVPARRFLEDVSVLTTEAKP